MLRESDLHLPEKGVRVGVPGGMQRERFIGPSAVSVGVRVQIADRVWGGADGAYDRSLSRVVTNARCRCLR
jgi:hypothetical protein